MTKLIEGKVISSISTKNQITVPAEVLLTLGLHPRDKIIFLIKNGTVEIKPAKNTNLQLLVAQTSIKKSDNLKLPSGYVVEYQVQKVIKKRNC